MFKRRFRIFDSAREGISVPTQVDLVYGLTAIYNWCINSSRSPAEELLPLEELTADRNNDYSGDKSVRTETDGGKENVKREQIAKEMWEDYCALKAARSALELEE